MEQENKKNALSHLLTQSQTAKLKGSDHKGLQAQEMMLALLYDDPDAYTLIKDSLSEEDFTQETLKAAFIWMKQMWEEGLKPELSFGAHELPEGALSALTRAISRRYEFEDREKTIQELMEAIQANSFKEEAMHTNSEDMREMVRWYNQVKNKKSK